MDVLQNLMFGEMLELITPHRHHLQLIFEAPNLRIPEWTTIALRSGSHARAISRHGGKFLMARGFVSMTLLGRDDVPVLEIPSVGVLTVA